MFLIISSKAHLIKRVPDDLDVEFIQVLLADTLAEELRWGDKTKRFHPTPITTETKNNINNKKK